ncbi:MAG TPA: nucleotide exchange factor GrpE [Candidatus Eisenbacteria bacterium]
MKSKIHEMREPADRTPAEPMATEPNDDPVVGGAGEAPALEGPASVSRWEEEGGATGAAAPPVDREPAELPIDYKDRWLRAEADLQNYRRRAQRESELVRRAAEEAVLLELIGMVDDLERALDSARQAGAPEPWVQGVSLVVNRALDYLRREGVVPVDPKGQAFDPALHEAILEVDAPDGATPGSVVQVARKGYRRGERPLRAARVVVARGATRSDL